MNGNWNLKEPTRRPILFGVFVCLCAGSGLGVGCAAEHRLSLDEFLDLQRSVNAGQQATAQQAPAFDLDKHMGSYRVGQGDVLTVTMSRPDIEAGPIPVRVHGQGTIDLPIVGALDVAGRTLEDVEDVITAAYVPAVYQQAVCHVELTSAEPTNVLVVGAAVAPGLVPLRRTERNMLYAIVGAGGASEIASGRATLRRVRHPTQEVTLDLRDPVQLQAALTLDPLENGDIVHVHAAQPNTVFVGGLVARPAPQTYPAETKINVLQALAAAGGLRTDVAPKEGTLIRRMPNGMDAHVRLDLERLAVGADPNLELVAGDILWIPETFETKVQDFINRNIFMRAGVTVNYTVTGIEFLNRRNIQGARFGGGGLQDTFDPFGFLGQNAALQGLTARPAP